MSTIAKANSPRVTLFAREKVLAGGFGLSVFSFSTWPIRLSL